MKKILNYLRSRCLKYQRLVDLGLNHLRGGQKMSSPFHSVDSKPCLNGIIIFVSRVSSSNRLAHARLYESVRSHFTICTVAYKPESEKAQMPKIAKPHQVP